jgi:hypothetical protein
MLYDNFDLTDLHEHHSISFDYYFYMLLNGGFSPLHHEGKPISLKTDISCGSMQCLTDEDTADALKMPKIIAKDQLAMYSLHVIRTILEHFSITPRRGACIMLYDCPKYIQRRVQGYYDSSNKIAGVDLVMNDSVGQLIGTHKNIIAIIVWRNPSTQDEIHQIIGRMIRLNNFGNELTFYITISSLR